MNCKVRSPHSDRLLWTGNVPPDGGTTNSFIGRLIGGSKKPGGEVVDM